MSDRSDPVRHPDAPAPGSPVPVHNPMCAGCGEENPQSLNIKLTAGEGMTIHGSVDITEMHQGARGFAHGGVIALVMDELLGSCNWLVHWRSVTAHLELDFVRPIPVGTTLALFAEGLWVERRKFFTRGEARLGGADGDVCVRGEALFVRIGEPRGPSEFE